MKYASLLVGRELESLELHLCIFSLTFFSCSDVKSHNTTYSLDYLVQLMVFLV